MNDIELKRQAMYKGHFEQSMSRNLARINSYKKGDTKTVIWSSRNPQTISINWKLTNAVFNNHTAALVSITTTSNTMYVSPDIASDQHTYNNVTLIKIIDWCEIQSGSIEEIQIELDSTVTPYTPYGVVDNGYEILQPNGENLRDYKIYGNSVQEGEPTPEKPIEVKSLGEKSKNLFDTRKQQKDSGSGILEKLDDVYKITGSNTYISSNFKINNWVQVIGQQLTISFEARALNNQRIGFKLAYIKSNGMQVGTIFAMNNNITGSNFQYYTFTSSTITQPPESDCVLCLILYSHTDSGNIQITYPTTGEYKNIRINEGLEDLGYTPYGNIISVNVAGKNLFDKNNYIYFNYEPNYNIKVIDNVFYGGGVYSYSRGACLVIENNGLNTYTLSHRLVTLGNATEYTIQLQCNDGFNNGWINDTNVFNTFSSTQISPITFTTNKKYICIHICAKAPTVSIGLRWQVGITDIQLEKGSTATPYTPYYNQTTFIDLGEHEPLRKIGDVADYIDFKKKRIVRNIDIKTFDANTSVNINTGKATANMLFFYGPVGKNVLSYNGLSNYFPPLLKNTYSLATNDLNKEMAAVADSTQCWYISIFRSSLFNSGYTEDIEGFKQFCIDNNIKIYYVLETPIEEDFPECLDIPTPEFDCTVTVSSGDEENKIEASGLSLSYYV